MHDITNDAPCGPVHAKLYEARERRIEMAYKAELLDLVAKTSARQQIEQLMIHERIAALESGKSTPESGGGSSSNDSIFRVYTDLSQVGSPRNLSRADHQPDDYDARVEIAPWSTKCPINEGDPAQVNSQLPSVCVPQARWELCARQQYYSSLKPQATKRK